METASLKGLSEKGLAVILLVVSGILIAAALITGNPDLLIVANKILNVGLVLAAAVLFNLYWRTRQEPTDEKISSDPLATAVYAGAVVIAAALAVSNIGGLPGLLPGN